MLQTFIIRNPNSTLSLVLSLIPFFSPVLMYTRIVVETPPWWQILASIVLLSLAIMLMTWLVGKIYRVGILMYGKKPSPRELLKWLRYS